MRILYGVCGEGLGHASRSRILINYLQKKHDVCIVAGGKAYEFLKKEFDRVEYSESVQFLYMNGAVHMWLTICWMKYRLLHRWLPSFFRVRKLIGDFNPDVVVTDADPVSHYAALTRGVPSVSIDNPTALLYRDYEVLPREFFVWLPLVVGVKLGMFNADRYLIYDFFNEDVADERVVFLKPLIQEGLRKQQPRAESHVFVYLTTGDLTDVTMVLQDIDERFIIYGCNRSERARNLVFKRFNENEFYDDIASAKAVINTGGFTVISEALYLQKPVFTVPVQGQFEQILNGKMVQRLGVGEYHTSFKKRDLQHFLQNLDCYSKGLSRYDAGDQQMILSRIEQEIQRVINR